MTKVGDLNVTVVRNDALTINQIRGLDPRGIILSPGPDGPKEAGVCLAVVRELGQTYPIFGVCLGHQVICQAYGASVIRAPQAIHGKACAIEHNGQAMFATLDSPLTVGRYHSLMADPTSIPAELDVLAHSQDGVIMAVAHSTLRIWGVQFHPESFLSEKGDQIISNFLRLCVG